MDNPVVSVDAKEFIVKGRPVKRFDCNSCGACALVPIEEIATSSMDGQLERGGFCRPALLAAAEQVRVNLLNPADSVLQ